jgi:ADP-heptose:LPS heptosyltransferase
MSLLRRNVLIFHQGALGDLILTWPLALALGRLYPQSRIMYVTHASKGALAERALGVEWLDAESGWHALHADAKELPDRARRSLEGAHTVVRFGGDANDAWWQNVDAIAEKVQKLNLRPAVASIDTPASQFILDQLRDIPVIYAATEQLLSWMNAQGLQIDQSGEHVVLHPGSGAREKCWPVDRFIAVAQQLKSAGHSVRFVVGEVERERFNRQELSALSAAAEIIPTVDYCALMGALAQARLFAGNDSGPGHLAGVMGIPTLSLFTATDPAIWKPMGPRVRTLSSQPSSSLYDKTVVAAILKMHEDFPRVSKAAAMSD